MASPIWKFFGLFLDDLNVFNEIIYRLQNDPCPNSGCGNLLSENKDEATNENDEERDKNAHSRMQKSCSQNGQKASGGENANKNAL